MMADVTDEHLCYSLLDFCRMKDFGVALEVF